HAVHSVSPSTNRNLAITCGLALAGLALFALARRPDQPQTNARSQLPGNSSLSKPGTGGERGLPLASQQLRVAPPFIRTDTATDSPGTNLVTRVVTLRAEMGGTPPLVLQWKVDKGAGFVAVS